MNVAHFLVRSALRFPQRPLWLMPDRTITYAEGRTRLDAIAGGLLTLGKVGDRVAIVSTNRFEAFEIYLAAMHAGMAATPMNPKLHAKEYEHIILDSGASIVVYSAEFEETMQEIRQSLPSGDRVFCIGSKTTTSLGRDYESLLTLSTTPFAGVNIDPGDLADELANRAFVLRWTSGSEHPLDAGFAAWTEVVVKGLAALLPAIPQKI